MNDCGKPFTACENGYTHLCARCGVDEVVHTQDTLGRTGRDRRIDGEPVWIHKLRRMHWRATERRLERRYR